MNSMKHFKGLLLSLLMYLPTCVYMPSWIYLILILVSIYLNLDFLKCYFSGLFKFTIKDKTFSYLLVFAFLIFILRVIDLPNWDSIKDVYSFAYLFPFTYLVARLVKLNEVKVIKYILMLIAVEALVACFEYIYGISTFFTGIKLFREFENYKTLYYTRVFGLSTNSSGLSLKLFLGLVLLNKSNFKTWVNLSLEFLFLISSVLVFGRIVLLVIPIYYVIKICTQFYFKNLKKEVFIPLLAYLLFFGVNINWTQNQFTRYNMKVAKVDSHEPIMIENTDNNDGYNINNNSNEAELILVNDKDLTEMVGVNNINMAGRNKIWNHYFDFSKSNWFLGNYGKKYVMNAKTHAHNSYLEILASFGVVLSCLLMLIFVSKIKLKNLYLIIPVLIIAMGQYFIFWGISFFDIIFYYLIFFNGRKLNEK